MLNVWASDIEADNLLDKVTKFHCASLHNVFTGERKRYYPWDFKKYIEDIEAVMAHPEGLLIFHNGIKYDIPALDKLKRSYFGKRLNVNRKHVFDTLVATRLVYANIKDADVGLLKSGRLPGKRFGSHALEAWGYRLGEMKGEYKDDFKKRLEEQGEAYVDGMEWLEYNEDMGEYCVQDVVVTVKLFLKIISDSHYFPREGDNWSGNLIEAVRLEHEAAWLMAKQERNGYPVDVKALEKLYQELQGQRAELLLQLQDTFGSWYRPKGGKTDFLHPKTGRPLTKYPRVVYPKQGSVYLKDGKTLAKTDKMEGAPYTPVEFVTFSPTSREHIAKVLIDRGWKPIDFTDNGAPIVSDEVLEHVKVEDPKAQEAIELVRAYLMIQKRIGQIAEGDNAWLRMVGADGRIHGSVNPNGAVTGRATHSFPNMAQVPSAPHDKDGPIWGQAGGWGCECRAAFGAEHNLKDGKPDPWIQVGVDASGLELRCLGHFLQPFDDGQYADTVVNGDIHTQNQMAAGLPTRNNAKTFIYGFLYGAGAAKIGLIVGGDAKRGKELINKFLEGTPAIKAFREAVKASLVASETWTGGQSVVKWKRRWVRGLDGRKVHVRSPHSAVNTILQSAGALICKKWIVLTEQMLLEKGYKHGWDGDFAYMAWIHDEIQVACRTQEIADDVIKIAQEAMRITGEFFGFRCVLDTEGKSGKNWRECH